MNMAAATDSGRSTAYGHPAFTNTMYCTDYNSSSNGLPSFVAIICSPCHSAEWHQIRASEMKTT
jgi:hypothetical protein